MILLDTHIWIQIHGAINESNENAIFVSIYSAPNIGYEKASL